MSIKRHLTACALGISAVFSVAALPLPVQAVELVRWERIPLPVSLHVGEERIVFVEKNVRVGFPPSLNEKLRIQSTGGAVYLRAESAFPQTRLQLQDVESGEILLLDVTATAGKGKLEPVRVVYSGEVSTQRDSQSVRRSGQAVGAAADAVPESVDRKAKTRYPAPLPVLLTRYAAQSLYAPLRTVEPVSGVQPLPLTLPKTLTALYPSEPLIARPLAGWQAAEYRVVAVKLTNQSAQKVVLDPRQLQGQFVSATFQHQWLDAKGTPEDTTTVYLVMKGKPDKAFPAEPPVRRTGGKAR
ncbi:TIGR03749 family integrating conjugative element protein [Proteus mirabilis]|uniref:TIGR03749 family integrating conjugative element protein n=1 Tax=Proteus mirabilis TaxID=584 RepID=UPI0006698094|nr:TIGR03749 family integrating conjugative element protein [Proteus mirabilis]